MAMATIVSLLSTTTSAATVSLMIPPSPQIPNPAVLPPSTHATLTALGVEHSAPITIDNTFVFRNVTPGSYLADVYCATHGFAPLQVDVTSKKNDKNDGVEVNVWETFRGHDWDNKGEQIRPTTAGGPFPVKVLGSKVYYMERGGCKFSSHFLSLFLFPIAMISWVKSQRQIKSIAKLTRIQFNVIVSILSILKNPMILMGLVSLALFVGMPKLVENSTFHTRGHQSHHITIYLP